MCSERDTCSRYAARIINMLMNIEADPIKMEKQFQKNCSMDIDYFITMLIHTLNFLDTFGRIDYDNSAFVAAIVKYDITKKNSPRFKLKRVDDSIHEFSRKRGAAKGGQQFTKMVVDCASLDSDEEMSRSMSKSSSILIFVDDSGQDNILNLPKIEYPFTFQYLSKNVRSAGPEQIFDEYLRQLNGSAGCTISALPYMQGRTIALLLMLRDLLTLHPCYDDGWMQRASSIVSSFYKWPKPYGAFARRMIKFLNTERRSPGTAITTIINFLIVEYLVSCI